MPRLVPRPGCQLADVSLVFIPLRPTLGSDAVNLGQMLLDSCLRAGLGL